jgi:hypothetical protein
MTAPAPKWPSDLMRKNQRILADRQHWPEGALQACVDLEDHNPGWYVSWLSENVTSGFERPAGFWATYDDPGGHHDAEAFDTDAGKLGERIAEVPPHDYDLKGCAWCYAHPGRTARL